MNWRKVARLVSIDLKSARLIRGRLLTRYTENRFLMYVFYGGVTVFGLLVGGIVGLVYSSISNSQMKGLLHEGAVNLMVSLPTLVLIYGLVFTMMQQIQRSGAKFSIQVPYWLPITWEEHTCASVLANLFGFPLASILFIGSGVLVASAFMEELLLGVFTVFSLLASGFTASLITEIFRVLQVRFIGAVYRSSGRAAVWIRFIGSMIFIITFYIGWFSITSGAGTVAFIGSLSSAQNTVWFIPFVWLGVALFSFTHQLFPQWFVFAALSLLFVLSLFQATVELNRRFGLYEPPAISVSRGGYAPRAGLLRKLGFSSLEAALIRKDFKAFTRRRELMYIFILPVVFILMPLLQSLGAARGSVPTEASPFLFAFVVLAPGALMAAVMGSMMVGEEGGAIWRIYSSPVSARSLLKCKYTFVVSFSLFVATVTGVIGALVFHPSLQTAVTAGVESVLLVFTLGSVSLITGIKGADFTELPRPRMIRTEWAIINLAMCLLAASAMLVPFIPYLFTSLLFGSIEPQVVPYHSIMISAIIAATINFITYRMALQSAVELLARGED